MHRLQNILLFTSAEGCLVTDRMRARAVMDPNREQERKLLLIFNALPVSRQTVCMALPDAV